MNDLITINGNNTVAARELHKFLEIGTQFTVWFNRMCEYGFIEGTDFRAIVQKRLTAQNNTTTFLDFEITLDMAKEISMIQRTEKGKQARLYFINCEKKLKEVIKKPLSALGQLKLQYLALEEHDKEIQQIKADVTYLENNMPLFNIECKELQALVRKIGIKTLGGYKSAAYKNKSTRTKVYIDIQQQLKRQFGVTRYEAIKRRDLLKAKEIVNNYEAPTILVNEILMANNQIPFTDFKPAQIAYL